MKTFGVQWHITNTCNLRCKHCYQDDYTRLKDLNTSTVKDIIQKLVHGLPGRRISVNLTGGEPFLRKDIFEILEFLDQTEAIEDLFIITNGSQLDRRIADRLAIMKKMKAVKVSLEGSNATLNDSIRGPGSFHLVNQNMELLRLRNLPVILMFTLADYNARDVISMFEYAKNLGIKALILERFVPEGQSRTLIKQALTREQWFKIIRDIINYFDLGLSPHDFLAYRAFWIDYGSEAEIHGALCDHGESSMALMPNGDVYPCRRTPVKIGNILSDDMPSILERLRELRDSYRLKLKGKCGECRIDECIGCRALARSLCDDIYAEDPQCYRDLL